MTTRDKTAIVLGGIKGIGKAIAFGSARPRHPGGGYLA